MVIPKGGKNMELLMIIYILVFVIFALVAYAIMQIRLLGIKVKDFWDFIEANQMLDKLYYFAKQYQKMSPQEQVIYLSEAEKKFLQHLIKYQKNCGKMNMININKY